MAFIQSLPGFAALGWTRMQGAQLPVLLFKSFVVLAAALTALRLFSLG
jgi:hypothetical protein